MHAGGETEQTATRQHEAGVAIEALGAAASRVHGRGGRGGSRDRRRMLTHIVHKVKQDYEGLAQHDGHPEEDVADLLAAQRLRHQDRDDLARSDHAASTRR